ncbi:MAG: hypothetical protein ACYTEU_05275 [Planctomycetota bacterium]|jgi:hypothetical protein
MKNSTEMEQNETQPQEKRGFWGCCAVFFRWLFILLFAVVLLGGLYFKAPWKILVLDGLLLALLTVVPKQKRKYGWLTLAAAVLAVTVWIFIPEKDSGNWRPYTFDEEVAALNKKYGVPDEENAARFYEQIEVTDFYPNQTLEDFFNADREKKGPDLWDPNDDTMSRPWTAKEFPEMAAWLETEKAKIAPFWLAVKYEKCWFEVKTDLSLITENSREIGKYKKTAWVIQRMIQYDLGNGNIHDASEKILSLLQSSYHFRQQGSLLYNLLGHAISAMAFKTIQEVVVNYPLDNETIKTFYSHIEKLEVNWGELRHCYLLIDKIRLKNYFALEYEVDDNENIRFSRQSHPFSTYSWLSLIGYVTEQKELPGYWSKRKNKSKRFIKFMTYPDSPQEIRRDVDEVYTEIQKRAEHNDFEYRGPMNWKDYFKYDLSLKTHIRLFKEVTVPAYSTVYEINKTVETKKRGVLIIIALKRYHNINGHWPGSLDPIKDQLLDDMFVDSLNEQGFIYKRPENCDTFILYSCGEDGIDDGGFKSYSWGESEKRKDDILIWPRNEDELKKMLGIEEPKEEKDEDVPEGMMMDGMMMQEMMGIEESDGQEKEDMPIMEMY